MKTLNEQQIKELQEDLHSENDRFFFERVWTTNPEIYENRLRAIGLFGLDSVLDAGSGMGQWLVPLAKLNNRVTGIEFDQDRYTVTKHLIQNLTLDNAEINHGSVEELPYEDESFDGIFSYSVILCTDYRKTLSEYYRVLKPGGKLYFNCNGLGWYLYNLLNTHNDTKDFSSQDMAVQAIETTLHYYGTGDFKRQKYAAIIPPLQVVLKDLKTLGFRSVEHSGEGGINHSEKVIQPFFKGEYNGKEGVTEYLCEK